MAMNKYGRATKMTSPPPGSASTSWNDYGKYVSNKKFNEDLESAYKGSLVKYDKSLKYYNEGPEPTKEEEGNIKIRKGGKTRKGQQVTYEEGERYSAAKANADLEKALKENPNLVDINDKSINPTSRKIWMEQVGADFSGSDLYGKQTGKRYVDKNEINKIKSLVDVHGENFDMREWRKASEDKDPNAFDRYLDEKGYRGRTFVTKDEMGAYIPYNKPTPPEKPVPIDNPVPPGAPPTVKFKIGGINVPIPATDGTTPAPKPILSKKLAADIAIRKGEKSEVTVPTEKKWEDPEAKRYKTKREIVKRREGGQDQRIKILSKKIGESGSSIRMSKSGSTEQVGKGIRYNREQKAAKAFYAPKDALGFGGYYAMTDEVFDDQGLSINTAKLVKSKRQDIRGAKQEFRQNTELKGAEKREGIKDYRSSMKTNREATREARQGDLIRYGDQKWQAGDKSRLKYYTPDRDKTGAPGAMSGYTESAQNSIDRFNAFKTNEEVSKSNADLLSKYGKERQAEKWSQKSTDNATNRNTVMSQMEKYKQWGSKIK